MGVISTRGKSLVEEHAGARVACAFWECTCGDLSKGQVEARSSCVPAKAWTRDRQGAERRQVGGAGPIQAAKFLELGTAGFVTIAERFVDDIASSRIPKFDGARNSKFMQDVMDAIATWMTTPQEGSSGSEAVVLHGARSRRHVQEGNQSAEGQVRDGRAL
jgi:hypothetical protein